MNFLIWLTAVLLLLLTSIFLLMNAYPYYSSYEPFFDWNWKPWRGHWNVPWYSGSHSYWRSPYYQFPLPATGGITPGPYQCEDVCPSHVCHEYRSRQKKLNQCLNCRRQGKCIVDTASGQCGKCDQADLSLGNCYEQYGCRDVDFERGNFPLLDPSQTKCQLCPT